ncbi:DNA-directed RNA polymerase sigma-70 factor [Methylobacterium oxalidis]|uniref:DNA-directed RNA polymerase sigma-70 factor n=2 Tax=Methylobacterium oxalidis TaxID=944322 RepID=A0A512IZN2_9HYPH|nr:DNA-directed RNA polymerase sigma-70 factor [Methylobacterium oxalidis]GJE31450.1 RNA polymerase sigma factor SigI [Methylobacterium oxalidis]GLS67430.1 DNA-directed RNA polymerase sigma-70 factor [Methylobacterium oxalidis]
MAALAYRMPMPGPTWTRSDALPAMQARHATGPGEASLSAAMRAAQDGDAAAYRRVLRACVPVIAGVACGQGVRGAAVDDVVQEALLTIHRARATYDPARPFLPWLRAIAQRRAVDALRRQSRRPQEVHDPASLDGQEDAGPAPGQALEEGQEARLREARLARAVASLPAGQRQAVEHLALHERSLAEASALTGRSKGALKVNLHRALKSLRAALAPDREGRDV